MPARILPAQIATFGPAMLQIPWIQTKDALQPCNYYFMRKRDTVQQNWQEGFDTFWEKAHLNENFERVRKVQRFFFCALIKLAFLSFVVSCIQIWRFGVCPMSRALSLYNSFSNSYIRKNIRQIMLLRAKGNQEFFLDFFSQESKGDNITTDYTMGNRWLHGNEKSFLQTLFV